MSNNESISIITIVLNGESLIEETIQSVIYQENVKFEYIIIDGGSKDKTLQKIEKYKSKIDILISEPDKGIYDAINKGIRLAKGSLIGIIHCGDYYEPDALSCVYNEFLKTSANVIHGDIKTIEQYSHHTIIHCLKANHLLLKEKMSIFHPATFVKHECYIKYGFYNSNYKIAADYDLFLKLYLNNLSFQYIPKVLANFRVGGISGTKPKILFKENFQIRKERLGIIQAVIYIASTIPIHIFYTFRKFCIEFIIGKQNFIKLKYYMVNKRKPVKDQILKA